MDYQPLIEAIYSEVQQLNLQGTVANYIPELAKVDANKFGISLVTTEGKIYEVGDTSDKFSIQSISKVFTLAMVYPQLDEALWTRVGVEPSGTSFNSLVQLEAENGIPRNPLINAGALVVTDIIRQMHNDPADAIVEFISSLTPNPQIGYNKHVAISELKHSSRNKALAHFMKSYGNIHSRIDKLIETYCFQCAIEMSCVELAQAFLLFANQGVNLYNSQRILTTSQSKRLNAILQTCGFYDEAGEFAFKVGLPGKSGVGGGIAAVLPGKFSVVVWSPGLNPKGNSMKGMTALEMLTTKLGYSVF